MNKIRVIIGREYLHIIRKKSFLIMTVLGPIILAALIITPTLINLYGKEKITIAVLDETKIFSKLNSPNDRDIGFVYVKGDVDNIKKEIIDKKYTALLYIPDNESIFGGMIYSTNTLNTGVISNVLAAMKRNLSNEILIQNFNISKDSFDLYIEKHTNKINLGYTHINKEGQEETKASHEREIQYVVGLVAGILIYMFIFMYGSMVLRGVLEEKTNRIVEIMVSSVKPIQLMIGKIVGVALIGLTQIVVWIVFTVIIVTVFKSSISSEMSSEMANNPEVVQTMPNLSNMQNNTALMGSPDMATITEQVETNEFMKALYGINYIQLIALFLFYFVCGYFLYSTLYAAVGSAVDNDTDTQQFLLPLTVPLLLSVILSSFVADNPGGQVAFWLSIIPFTSPISMLMRIPAGSDVVQTWELFLSCSILILTCIASAWMAAKIYRTGILMYGKKVSYKELWKWLKYKN
jgi:ABC-2 type transport system permease protein